VDLSLLPTSDELSVAAVRISGARARARLASGATIRLVRAAERWRVAGISPP
jgi:hypothetical protein